MAPANRIWLLTLALAGVGLLGTQVVLYMAYFYAPVQVTPGTLWVMTPDSGAPISLYESYRILFIHVPCAYTTAACCVLTALGGVLWLLTRKEKWEALVVSAAEVGLCSGAIVLLTGTMWADYAWGSGRLGSGWNWEPRLTTMLILWLAFAALLVLRKSVDQPRPRSTLTAVYGILLGPLYPLVSKAVEIDQISHPRDFKELVSAPEISLTLQLASVFVVFGLLSLVALRYQWNRLGQQIAQEKA